MSKINHIDNVRGLKHRLDYKFISSMNLDAGFMTFMYFFETYLDLRQYSALKLPTLPPSLVGVVSQDKFEKARAYSLDKR